MLWRPPTSTLFPYTTLFRSVLAQERTRRRASSSVGWARRRGRLSARGLDGLRQQRDRSRDRDRPRARDRSRDRKSTRLNSSHQIISYAVFCLKKKNNKHDDD